LEVPLHDCTPELLRKLRTFEPYGPGAPAPVFLSRDVKLAMPPKKVGKDGRHIRVSIKVPGAPQNITAVGFGLGHRIDALGSTGSLDVVFKVETECYRGVLQPRITLLDFWSERH
jgi:single-stranded-DNA-specific exonuclease